MATSKSIRTFQFFLLNRRSYWLNARLRGGWHSSNSKSPCQREGRSFHLHCLRQEWLRQVLQTFRQQSPHPPPVSNRQTCPRPASPSAPEIQYQVWRTENPRRPKCAETAKGSS